MSERAFKTYVVRIIDDKTIIINYGSDNNEDLYISNMDELAVSIGDKIKIIQPGEEIIDPFTNESLGYYDHTKEVLEIVEMYQNMSVCKKVVTKTLPSGALSALTSLTSSQSYTTFESLNVKQESIEQIGTSSINNVIEIGDPVIFV